jgi:hypothetical protein
MNVCGEEEGRWRLDKGWPACRLLVLQMAQLLRRFDLALSTSAISSQTLIQKVKRKFVPVLKVIKHYATKTYVGMHVCLTSELVGGQLHVPAALHPKK